MKEINEESQPRIDQIEEQKSFEILDDEISQPPEIDHVKDLEESSSEEEATDIESLRLMVRKMLKP
jgi:hypothetical protein